MFSCALNKTSTLFINEINRHKKLRLSHRRTTGEAAASIGNQSESYSRSAANASSSDSLHRRRSMVYSRRGGLNIQVKNNLINRTGLGPNCDVEMHRVNNCVERKIDVSPHSLRASARSWERTRRGRCHDERGGESRLEPRHRREGPVPFLSDATRSATDTHLSHLYSKRTRAYAARCDRRTPVASIS